MGARAMNLTGKTFGLLTVVETAGKSLSGPILWRCTCACGGANAERIVSSSNLNSGSTTSCGCQSSRSTFRGRTITHGMTGTRVYSSWMNMKQQCYNEKCVQYPRYGGRGVSVCEEWKDSFESFYADMGDPMSGEHDLKLVDRTGNYTPDNCEWATVDESPSIRKNGVTLTYDDRTMSLSDWSLETGMPLDILKSRRKLKWSDEDILTKPVRGTAAAQAVRKPRTDKTGMVYGRLTVVNFSHMEGSRPYWNCLCSCEEDGKPHLVRGDRLAPNLSTSCGCLMREANTTHGMESSRVYSIWRTMRKRCHSENAPNYARYGGRGISVCERWRDSFENFYADMGDPTSKEHTLDREDNDGDYEPGNCRWATVDEQQSNRSDNRFLEHGGERLTVSQWGRKLGVGDSLILNRLNRGWSVHDALTKPVQV